MRKFLPCLLLLVLAALSTPWAQDWGAIANISTTLGVNANRLCVGEGSRGDIGCPTYAPSLTTVGDLELTAGLTTNNISLTTTGTTWGYLRSNASYLPNFSSNAISTTNITATTINGMAISSLGASATVISGTTTMVPNWPDAIMCQLTGNTNFYDGLIIVYLTAAPWDGDNRYYYKPTDNQYTAINAYISFNSDGSFHETSFDGTVSCANRTITTLYAESKAFNFIGNTGAGGGSAMGDRLTSGTLSVTANSTTSVVSLTTAGTTWGYLGSTASYLPNLSSNVVSTSNISVTNLNGRPVSNYLFTSSSVPAFAVHKNGTNQTITANTWTKITFSTKRLDTQNAFNTSTNRFQPTVEGNYLITGNARCGTGTTASCWLSIYKNGSQVTQNGIGSGSDIIPHTSAVVSLNGSTDYVELYIYSTAVTIDGFAAYTRFEGSLLGGASSGSGGGGGATALSGLTDVSLASPVSESLLAYNGSAWTNINRVSVTTITLAPDAADSCTTSNLGMMKIINGRPHFCRDR